MLQLAIMWTMLIVPWLTLFFMDGTDIRRYLPVALFVTVINVIVSLLAYYYGWWSIRTVMVAWVERRLDVPLIFGIFPPATMWIFRFLYRRPIWYFIFNASLNAFFAYFMTSVFDRMDITTLGNISQTQIFLLMFGSAVVIYLFQLWYEREDMELRLGRPEGERDKAGA